MVDNLGGRPRRAGGVDPFADLPRCGAKNRRGEPCRRVGNARNGRCHLHGGRSPGGPRGAGNGNFKHGFYGLEARSDRSRLRDLIRKMRIAMDEMP
jgi:hypothetical protein